MKNNPLLRKTDFPPGGAVEARGASEQNADVGGNSHNALRRYLPRLRRVFYCARVESEFEPNEMGNAGGEMRLPADEELPWRGRKKVKMQNAKRKMQKTATAWTIAVFSGIGQKS